MRLQHLFAASAAVLAAPAFALNLCPGWDDPLPPAESRYEVFASPYTHHWSHDDDHKHVYLLSLSRRLPNNRSCGLALFSNSFGQPSAYAFAAKTFPNLSTRWPELYATVSAGVIYGYVGKYKNKVPLNVAGFSPVIVPSVGYRINDRFALEVQLLGTAAFMVGTTVRF